MDYIVIALMLASGLYTTLTGLIADLFGLHQVILHNEAGCICAGSIIVHIALNGPSGIAYVRSCLVFPRELTWTASRRPPRDHLSDGVRFSRLLFRPPGGFIAGWLIPDRRQELPGDAKDIGALYHAWSSPGRSLNLPVPDWGGRPPQRPNLTPTESSALSRTGMEIFVSRRLSLAAVRCETMGTVLCRCSRCRACCTRLRASPSTDLVSVPPHQPVRSIQLSCTRLCIASRNCLRGSIIRSPERTKGRP